MELDVERVDRESSEKIGKYAKSVACTGNIVHVETWRCVLGWPRQKVPCPLCLTKKDICDSFDFERLYPMPAVFGYSCLLLCRSH